MIDKRVVMGKDTLRLKDKARADMERRRMAVRAVRLSWWGLVAVDWEMSRKDRGARVRTMNRGYEIWRDGRFLPIYVPQPRWWVSWTMMGDCGL